VIGVQIEAKQYPGKKLTISGVFDTLPENSNYKYDILVSMVSTKEFAWDGSNNWLGNDRYYAYVKLLPGVDPKSLAPSIRKMQEKHQDIIKIEQEQGGVFLKYSLIPIQKIHTSKTMDMIIILATIAIAVLFVSLMNYVLLTLSTLINRSKTSAIHKTCGAQASNMYQLIFSETFLLFLISVMVALSILIMGKPIVESQLNHSFKAVLNPYVIWPVLTILCILIVFTSYLPGRFFSRIPVTSAFRNYKQKRNKWKLALLSFQFIGASFILTIMIIVSLQYNNMKSADHGYQTKGIYYGSTTGMSASKVSVVLNELRKLPEIEKVGLGCDMPFEGASGNNILSPDGKRDLFNVADFYQIDENYLSILNIPVIHGKAFSPQTASVNDVLISQKGADLLKLNNKWDEVIGKNIAISEHGETTLRGVFPDFTIGSFASNDHRPSVFFYRPESRFIQWKQKDPSVSFNILIKVHENMQTGIQEKISHILNLSLPQNDAEVKSLEDELLKNYATERGFRNGMMMGNFVVLLMTIIGLLGYTTNEATRRRKELAIRRINGASLSSILKVFIIDLQYIAIPAVIVGLSGAWFVIDKWMQNFASKIPLRWEIFVGCSFCILILVATIAVINYVRIANRNPVEALRYE
ncbi:MAG: FtsX-like permease family protein, partial [Carboxylicivirga sp.]|jgi:putative ABC transport system permease protein|nr:FtsX-like permease family protein [Carboxylicivirga sp.]